MPGFIPGSLDAAAILKSVNETLLLVVETELEQATERLGAALADKETEADLVSVFRAELMRRVLPQFTEAVRSGVLESIRTRQMHLAQLAVLHRQTLDAKSLQVVVTRLDHLAAKAGLQIVGDSGDQSLFNVVEDPPGVMKKGPVTLELVAPAYVDKESGKLVERGWLRAVAKVPPEEMTRRQRRRAAHAEGEKTQSEKEAPAQQERKKVSPRSGTRRQQNRGNERENGGSRPSLEGNVDRRMKQRGTR
ncbi:hypothetical protein [Streptomyces sp. NRRL F-2799]|uniref:hypothetical protein n=1 Tax=Streptomyces sp. NRRL F-2799 TaxID=1463844 RepID=UPI0004C8C3F3|nr:hypothetical protein [Streptomyces sp. NRRL F-2799]